MSIPKQAGKPEYHLQCPKGEVDANAIYCAIFRAQAVLHLLRSNFEEAGGSRLSDELIINAIDGVVGYLDQINILMSEA